MLILIVLTIFYNVINAEDVRRDVSKSYISIPVPIELPNRNDRADQCWLRIEDTDLVETIAVYCHIARTFLRNFIHDYNSMKMMEDDVDVSLWAEEPRPQLDINVPKFNDNNQKNIKDWKVTTILDPSTRMRLYVTTKADCRMIMYTREGVMNYKVDCDKILYFVNSRMNSSTTCSVCWKLIMIANAVIVFLTF